MKPREVVFRGMLEASGMWLSAELLGERRARVRVLQLWEPSTRVFATGGGMVLRFARSRRIDAQCALGTPLVEVAGTLVAAPLAAADLCTMSSACVLVRAVRAARE